MSGQCAATIRQDSGGGYLIPNRGSAPSKRPIVRRPQSMSSQSEQVLDYTVNRQKPLRLLTACSNPLEQITSELPR